ncbi:uncharacterized protein ACA1_046020 [Acanthamoeba castellanii str. Neff]|uniref:Transmembrane protein n=1 Tax=Acanthamoeba castellanii (strain ATCC 30010 / Neff) TaxID=1257118 RepID=L8HAZ6_ACACF|nr:uncharacterized protein ACA1_046020 [Acanthamoeba castellanii str. Neff]ELR21903.1 hypothetical protein ACA1_046020 [Acanthamoeba castellanii str. Neff]
MQKAFDRLNSMANRVLRVAYALWAVVHLSFTSLMWSLIVLSVLFLGFTATRNRQRFLLLIYIAAMCVVMALTALGLFLVLLGEVLTLSVDLVEIIVDGCSLLFELVTIALAYNLYLHLDPRNNVTLDELGTEASQAYPNDHSINIDLQQEFEQGNMDKLAQEPSPYAFNAQPNIVYSPYVYPVVGVDPNLSQAETMPHADVNPFQEPPK